MEKILSKGKLFHIPRKLQLWIPDEVDIETETPEDVTVEIQEVPDGSKPRLKIIIKRVSKLKEKIEEKVERRRC